MTPQEVYEAQIAPLMVQLDTICKTHGFSYLVAVEISHLDVFASFGLKVGCDKSMLHAYNVLNDAVVWDSEQEDKA